MKVPDQQVDLIINGKDTNKRVEQHIRPPLIAVLLFPIPMCGKSRGGLDNYCGKEKCVYNST